MREISNAIVSRTVLLGDAKHIPLRDKSVHCVVTSPPFWALRQYPNPASIGHEVTFAEHLGNLRAVFREVWRVLRDDGTLWLEYGDKWCGSANSGGADDTETFERRKGEAKTGTISVPFDWSGLAKEGSLMLMPARVAMALEADRWHLRAENIWSRPNPMPESCRNRTTRAHSFVFMLTKVKTGYYYDQDAERTASDEVPVENGNRLGDHIEKRGYSGHPRGAHPAGANLRSVWSIPTEPLKLKHYAAFPTELVRRCVSLGTSARGCCPECGAGWVRITKRLPKSEPTYTSSDDKLVGGKQIQRFGDGFDIQTLGWQPSCSCGHTDTVPAIVLDPFCGSGTTLCTAEAMGRNAIGMDISEEYAKMALMRQYRHRVVTPSKQEQMEMFA